MRLLHYEHFDQLRDEHDEDLDKLRDDKLRDEHDDDVDDGFDDHSDTLNDEQDEHKLHDERDGRFDTRNDDCAGQRKYGILHRYNVERCRGGPRPRLLGETAGRRR